MSTLTMKTLAGADAGTIELDDSWFGIEPNIPVMHQVVTAQLAARRSGTQSTKTRAEVNRTGKKSRRQKGGGTSRQGSMRAPHFVGGGVALGPKPRSYAQRTPKKMINLALRSALSDRFSDGHVLVIKEWGLTEPKTKSAIAGLAALGLTGGVLLVLDPSQDGDLTAGKSFANLGNVQLVHAGELNVYDVLVNDWVVFSKHTVPGPRSENTSAENTSADNAAGDNAADESEA